MSWNLFDRIINAIKPGKESEQPVDTQPSCPEGASEQPEQHDQSEQPEGSEEPSSTFQQTPAGPQQDDWQS